MSDNPYKSPAIVPEKKSRGTAWAFRSGIACLVLAATCALLTVVRMIATLQSIEQSANSVNPSDFAEGIHSAIIPAYWMVPLGLLGALLLMFGNYARHRRQRASRVFNSQSVTDSTASELSPE